MTTTELNMFQEKELDRLIAYEQNTCTVKGDLVYRCAFPYRPDDDLQVELLEYGMLIQKNDERRGPVVTLTTDGYSYFPSKAEREKERKNQRRREMRLVTFATILGALCVIAGYVLATYL